MKIVAPVSSLQEVEMLLHNGADELYCGFIPADWEKRFGDRWWVNRRNPEKANFTNWDELGETIRIAHAQGVPVHLTLNAPFYPALAIRHLLGLSRRLVYELEVDSLIISDLNLLLRLTRLQLPVRIHLSSLGGCYNTETVNLYASLGVRRIILSRQLRRSEIRQLVQGNDRRPHRPNPVLQRSERRQVEGDDRRRLRRQPPSGMEFELFAMNDGCYFEEGACQASHALGPFCLSGWEENVPFSGCQRPSREDRGAPRSRLPAESQLPPRDRPSLTPRVSSRTRRPPSTRLSPKVRAILDDLEREKRHVKEYLWFQNNCGSGFQQDGLPNGPCSLCAFGLFRDWGVHAVKIVGREASFHRKLASLQLVKAVMDLVRGGASEREIAAGARSFRNTPGLCQKGYMCYYGGA